MLGRSPVQPIIPVRGERVGKSRASGRNAHVASPETWIRGGGAGSLRRYSLYLSTILLCDSYSIVVFFFAAYRDYGGGTGSVHRYR